MKYNIYFWSHMFKYIFLFIHRVKISQQRNISKEKCCINIPFVSSDVKELKVIFCSIRAGVRDSTTWIDMWNWVTRIYIKLASNTTLTWYIHASKNTFFLGAFKVSIAVYLFSKMQKNSYLREPLYRKALIATFSVCDSYFWQNIKKKYLSNYS